MHLYTSTGMIQLAMIFATVMIVTILIKTYGRQNDVCNNIQAIPAQHVLLGGMN